ncbi:MAG: PaaI family thioesterase [Candidatus Goldbacteria bacterium]|nr:PaaI family thioesterase [Candidatus Goldiibacteriota bacterium]
MTEWLDDRYCIACGDRNPIGMHLKFVIKDDNLETKYTFPREFQGYKDLVHGGMLSLLLDEIMVNLPLQKLKVPVVSADLRIKLKKPLRVGEKVIARAHIIKQKGRFFIVKGEIVKEKTNELIATGESICVKVGQQQDVSMGSVKDSKHSV